MSISDSDTYHQLQKLADRVGALELQLQVRPGEEHVGERLAALEALHGLGPGGDADDPAQVRLDQAVALLDAELGAFVLISRAADGNLGVVCKWAGDTDGRFRGNVERALREALGQEG